MRKFIKHVGTSQKYGNIRNLYLSPSHLAQKSSVNPVIEDLFGTMKTLRWHLLLFTIFVNRLTSPAI